MKTIAILRFWYEGNSFSPLPARRADFERREWVSGPGTRRFYKGKDLETGAAVDFLEAHPELEARFLRCAAAYPAGPVEAGLFPRFVEEVARGLRGRRWDGVYASLHGATVASDVAACESYLLERIRAEVGPAVVAASFDLHANLDPRIAELADIVVGYKTYPHVDIYDTGMKAMTLLQRAMAGEISPRSIVAPADFAPTSFHMRTTDGPMAEMAALAAEAGQRPGCHDVSVFGSFPYADSLHTGGAITACHEANAEGIDAALDCLGAEFRARAARFDAVLPEPAEVIRDFLARGNGFRMAVLEPSDNAFSGGAGDSPGLLRAALELAPHVPSVFAAFWDPDLVARAAAAGPGASLDCAFGGRLSSHYGEPVRAAGVVERLTNGRFVNVGPMEKGLAVDLGPSAVIRVGELRVVVASRNAPVNDPAYFALHGIDLAAIPLVYAKAKNHFRAAFAERFDAIVETETPGPAPSDISGLPYRHALPARLRFGRKWKENAHGA
jgi:microcystin degradation protein MlrC